MFQLWFGLQRTQEPLVQMDARQMKGRENRARMDVLMSRIRFHRERAVRTDV